jgi:EAL domain-containing protein (putative c-di-GMP-specific phosphodiesterase class I)
VGEWVGDEKTARLLENAGVAYMQGYFFGALELAKSALRNEVAESTAV